MMQASETNTKPEKNQKLFAEAYASCPVCFGKNLELDFTLQSPFGVPLQWQKCQCCGFTFMNPRLLPEVMYKIYTSDAYWNDSAYSQYFEGEAVRIENSAHRLKIYAKYIPQKGKLLDLACATGFFAYTASRLGYEVTGVDLNPQMIEFGRKKYNIDLRISTVENCEFEPGTFSVISMWGLDCHFFDFRSTFTKIISWLKPGGCILFGFQDYGHWIRWFFQKIKQDSNVYYNFTIDSLTRFMGQMGMKILYNKTGTQITQFHRITRSLKIGKKLLSPLDSVRIKIPTPSYNVAILQKQFIKLPAA